MINKLKLICSGGAWDQGYAHFLLVLFGYEVGRDIELAITNVIQIEIVDYSYYSYSHYSQGIHLISPGCPWPSIALQFKIVA